MDTKKMDKGVEESVLQYQIYAIRGQLQQLLDEL